MNIEELNTQIEYLKETKNLIKQQLISKGQPVDDNTTFREYADNMNNLVDTTDANATSDDVILNKTAYVNGQRVTGTLETTDAISIDNSNNTDTYLTLMNMGNIPSMVVGADINDLYGVRKIVEDGTSLEIIAPQSQIADVIGLTANKIALGETILGVTGTYAGSAMKEYASVTDMNNDIANISDGELVKVVESGTTSYFIKETISGTATMTKLVKESETMSPQEYTDANDIADEVLGN